jgi:hypothetical protein
LEVIGMRSDQYIGLNPRGRAIVEPAKHVLRYEVLAETRRYPDGSTEVVELDAPHSVYNPDSRVCGSFDGMFDDPFELLEYVLPDGAVYREFLQASPWRTSRENPCRRVSGPTRKSRRCSKNFFRIVLF